MDAGGMLAALLHIDGAGMHDMDVALNGDSPEISPRWLGAVRNARVAVQAVSWPHDLDAAVARFIAATTALEEALAADDAAAAAPLAIEAHEAQHEATTGTRCWAAEAVETVDTRRLGLLWGLVATLVATSLALPASAGAHAEFVRSTPPAGEAVREAPLRLDAWFAQEIFRREGANALYVVDQSGARADEGELLFADEDRRQMSVGLLPDLPPGLYTVYWRTLSATDGDTAEGNFTFTIDPDAPVVTHTDHVLPEVTPTAPEAAATVPDAATRFLWWALIAAVGILLAGVAGAWAVRWDGERP